MPITMFNLNVRFQNDQHDHAIWQVWRDRGELRVSLYTGHCYPWPFAADELGAVMTELYAKLHGQIADVRVTPAVE